MNDNKLNLKENGFSGYCAKEDNCSKHGVVVLMGGESVMLPILKFGKLMAEQFAKRGFIAVSVSLFGADGLGDSPDQIPVEYALNAIRYLRNSEKCERISVYGMSMGSTIALASAIYGKVDDLVMMSPSHVAFEGTSKDKKHMMHRSAFTYQGRDIPYVNADFSKYKMADAYAKAYEDKDKKAEAMAALPISLVKGRILLMAGAKDTSWPSAYSVQMLEKGIHSHYEKYIYPSYGHMLPLKKEVMEKVYEWLRNKESICH